MTAMSAREAAKPMNTITSTNAPTTLWVLGAGGHGRVVADAAAASGRFAEIVFFDDDTSLPARIGRFARQGDSAAFFADESRATTSPNAGANTGAVERHIAIGNNTLRDTLVRRCEAAGLALATVVHPAAVLSVEAEIAPGCFIAAGAIVAPGARLAAACIVNHAASVDHDVQLGRAVHVGPGARLGGAVTIGDRSWIGIGAVLRHGLALGRGVLAGAGAVVVADIDDGQRVVGNPARPLPVPPEIRDA